MGTRTKPQADHVYIQDADRAQAVMAEIAAGEREIRIIDAALNERIDRAKAETAAVAAPFRARVALLAAGLQAYATYHKEQLFTERRSVVTVFGEFGFRRSSEIRPKPRTTWAMILERISSLRLIEAMRVKSEVNREVLASWSDSQLEQVGAQRTEKDEFWYQVKEVEAAP